nr:hypothetical protein [Pandoraea apista]
MAADTVKSFPCIGNTGVRIEYRQIEIAGVYLQQRHRRATSLSPCGIVVFWPGPSESSSPSLVCQVDRVHPKPRHFEHSDAVIHQGCLTGIQPQPMLSRVGPRDAYAIAQVEVAIPRQQQGGTPLAPGTQRTRRKIRRVLDDLRFEPMCGKGKHDGVATQILSVDTDSLQQLFKTTGYRLGLGDQCAAHHVIFQNGRPVACQAQPCKPGHTRQANEMQSASVKMYTATTPSGAWHYRRQLVAHVAHAAQNRFDHDFLPSFSLSM